MTEQDSGSNKQQIKVRYAETSALYASQFIVSSTNDDVTINFSSGPMVDPGTGETMLPVHTRLAMTTEGAKRLYSVLGSVLQQQNVSLPSGVHAQVPKIKQ